MLRLLAPIVGEHPLGFGHVLQALDFYLAPVREVAIVGSGRRRGRHRARAVVRGAYRPHVVLAGGDGDAVPLLEGRAPVDGRAGGLRLRALRLPGAGHRPRGAGGRALTGERGDAAI